MTTGRIVINNNLSLDITNVRFVGGEMIISARAFDPKKKTIPVAGVVSFVVYGEDGSRVAIGVLDGAVFEYAHRYIRHGYLYLELPVKFVDILTNVSP